MKQFLLGLLLLAPLAHAIPITYLYAGPNFSTPLPSGVPAGVTNIAATFTVDIGANYSGYAPIADWTISDGYTTITSGSPDHAVTSSDFYTDALGEFTRYTVGVQWWPHGPEHPLPMGINYWQYFDYFGPHPAFSESHTAYCAMVDSTDCIQGGMATGFGPGRLTAISIPEPGTLGLLAAGLLGLALLRRRRAAA